MENLIKQLKNEGFEGFVTVNQLAQNLNQVGKDGGIYLVLYTNDNAPEFLEIGTGGHFKRKDPNVSLEELAKNWIKGEHIVYIGKADQLNRRLKELLKFGQGEDVAHWGGRFIWQIKEAQNLVICWKYTVNKPEKVEKEMIQAFKSEHNGERPFANLKD